MVSQVWPQDETGKRLRETVYCTPVSSGQEAGFTMQGHLGRYQAQKTGMRKCSHHGLY